MPRARSLLVQRLVPFHAPMAADPAVEHAAFIANHSSASSTRWPAVGTKAKREYESVFIRVDDDRRGA
jgi:hypothetical protein